MLFAKLIIGCLCQVGARRIVSSHLQFARNALESSRQVLGAIQQELSDDEEEDGHDIVNYVAGKVLDQCQKLNFSTNASTLNSLKDHLKASELCEQHGDKLLAKLSENLNNSKTAEWICSQGFELAAIRIDGQSCRKTSQLLLRGLQDTLAEKDQQLQLVKLGIYLVRAAVVVTPLPGPLGWILDKATQMLLKKLTKDAEEALNDLEKQLQKLERKMWDISRQVVAEEFLRVGGEQVKVAEDQVKDIETIDEDDLWRNFTDPALQPVVMAAKKATSFNRWAAIEQSLATTLAILRPPDFMDTSEEMGPFIRVMKIHFEIEITVLSHMFKVLENGGSSLKKMVKNKAKRAALAVFPYLFILGSDEALLATVKSPLLEVTDSDPCEVEGPGHLVCVWLRLLSTKQKAKGFESPWSFCSREPVGGSKKYYQQTKTFGFGTFGHEGFGVFVDFVNKTEKLLNFKCGADDQYIAQWREIHDESKYFGKDTVEGKCVALSHGVVQRHLKFTSTSTFCATMLTYGNISVGELVSAKFEEEPVTVSRCDLDPMWHFSRRLASSTCYISNIMT